MAADVCEDLSLESKTADKLAVLERLGALVTSQYFPLEPEKRNKLEQTFVNSM